MLHNSNTTNQKPLQQQGKNNSGNFSSTNNPTTTTTNTSTSCQGTRKASHNISMSRTVRCVLVDVSCILHVSNRKWNNELIDAILALRKHKRIVKFVLDTTTRKPKEILKELNQLGYYDITVDDIITTTTATQSLLVRNKFKPYCLMMKDNKDYKDVLGENNINRPPYNSVLVGSSASLANFENMNKAFRVLQKHPNLIVLHSDESMQSQQHQLTNNDSDVDQQQKQILLSLGPGSFCKTLSDTANCTITSMDKFSPAFLEEARISDIPLGETCFIGDNINVGIQNARDAGFGTTLLVKTGPSYQKGDENKMENGPSRTFDTVVDAMHFILSKERARAKKLMLGRKVASGGVGGVRGGTGRMTTTPMTRPINI